MAAALRILIADDEPLNAMALRSQLEALGHNVIGPAANGEEAVRLARTETFDLAILDVQMPRISGLQAAERIFEAQPVPIILLTGYSDPDHVNRALRVPVFQYLVKPVSMDDLGPAISVARSRFLAWEHLKEEAADLERRLAEQEVIQRAKAVLMKARDLSERDAYRLLRKESQNRHMPMAAIARDILLVDQLIHDAPRR